MIRQVPRGSEPLRSLTMLAGPSNSGKTWSALLMATGMVEVLGGKIAMLDTEQRGNQYEWDFDFDRFVMEPPFTPAAFIDAYERLDGKYSVIITDNFSDEHEGQGGLQEMAEASGLNNDVAKWAKPKAENRKLMARIRQLSSQHIFCLRALDKIEIIDGEDPNGRKKKIVRPKGWTPVCEKNFIYDITIGFMLPPGSKGHAGIVKTIGALHHAFREGDQVTVAYGRALAMWVQNKGRPSTDGGTDSSKSADAFWSRQSLAIPIRNGDAQAWQGRMAAAIKAAPDLDALMRLDADNAASMAELPPPASAVIREAIKSRSSNLQLERGPLAAPTDEGAPFNGGGFNVCDEDGGFYAQEASAPAAWKAYLDVKKHAGNHAAVASRNLETLKLLAGSGQIQGTGLSNIEHEIAAIEAAS